MTCLRSLRDLVVWPNHTTNAKPKARGDLNTVDCSITMTGSSPECIVDRAVLNRHTVTRLVDMGISVFAVLCGQNRGSFVLTPPDGRTYSCLDFPAAFAESVGAVNVTTSNDISTYFGN